MMSEEQPIFNNSILDTSLNQPSSNLLEAFQTDSTELSPNLMMNSASETLIDIGENQEDYTAENILDVGNIFNQVISSTKNALAELANHSDIDEILGTSFGVNYNQDIANDLINNFAKKDFFQSPNIKLVSGQVFNGAYAQENNTIYISQEFVAENLGNISTIQSVLLEEFGHYLDAQINVEDSVGDEGDIFQRLVQGISITEIELVNLKNENDFASLVIDSKELLIEQNFFQQPISSSVPFAKNNGGWTNNNDYPRTLGDVNGDGRADIVGFGNDAVFISLGNVDGTFQQPISSSVPFAKNNGGWTNNNDYPRMLGDVNGDGRADIVGFGNDAVFISLGNVDGTFQQPISSSVPFAKNNGGWTNNNDYPRMLGDVNGDGRADIVGFGNDAVFISLGNVDGTFQQPISSSVPFAKNNGGWTNNNDYPRMLGDVNGDGRADIVGFGNDAVFISLGNVDGTFQQPISSSVPFAKNNGGWTNNNDYPRMLGDVNGDGRADIVGFGNDAVFISLGNVDGTFQQPISSSVPFSKNNGGWTNNNDYLRTLGDVNGDGRADIVGFGNDAVFTSFGQNASTSAYYSELSSLTDNQWDTYSGDNTRFDGIVWEGERDERNLTPNSIKQIYTDLSVAVLGNRYGMTAGYLYDQSYKNGFGNWHSGIDMGAPAGTQVKTVTSGTVAWTWYNSERGAFIAVIDSDGKQWVYGHLQSTLGFYTGQSIGQGQVIGRIGNQSRAHHLHLEVRNSVKGQGNPSNQNFVRSYTMSPLQAFWQLQRNI